jgi:hypothetical protein
MKTCGAIHALAWIVTLVGIGSIALLGAFYFGFLVFGFNTAMYMAKKMAK